MTLQYVPIIDLGPYFGGTAEGKAEVAKAVNQACREADRARGIFNDLIGF